MGQSEIVLQKKVEDSVDVELLFSWMIQASILQVDRNLQNDLDS